MASQDRFGYKWKNAPEIPPEQYIQFRRWLDIDDFSIFKNKKIFDAGCGNSTNAFIVLQNGAKKVVAVDAFENTLKISRDNLKCFGNRADVKFLDLENTDKYPGKYDIVLCIGVLHHLENQRKVLEKLLSTISSFSNTVSNATGVAEVGDAAKTMLKDIEKIETDELPKILSDTVYITENYTDEITSVNDVEADVEPIFRTSGFRG